MRYGTVADCDDILNAIAPSIQHTEYTLFWLLIDDLGKLAENADTSATHGFLATAAGDLLTATPVARALPKIVAHRQAGADLGAPSSDDAGRKSPFRSRGSASLGPLCQRQGSHGRNHAIAKGSQRGGFPLCGLQQWMR